MKLVMLILGAGFIFETPDAVDLVLEREYVHTRDEDRTLTTVSALMLDSDLGSDPGR